MKYYESENIGMMYKIAYSKKFDFFLQHDEKVKEYMTEKIKDLIVDCASKYILDSEKDFNDFKDNEILIEEVSQAISRKLKDVHDNKVILTYFYLH